MSTAIKRVYDPYSQNDGFRILVDRLWPRGISKERAAVDLWLKDIAPSSGLRQWFNHDPAKFKEFSLKYQAELNENPALDELRRLIAHHKNVTLLFGAKDLKNNHAAVLKEFLTH